jgi:hypothetical protein
MVQNPFEIIERKLSGIEALLIEIKHTPKSVQQEPPDRMTLEDTLSFLASNGLPLKKSQLYKLSMEKDIPVMRFGKRLVFSRKAILEWLDNRMVKSFPIDELNENLKKQAIRKLKPIKNQNHAK